MEKEFILCAAIFIKDNQSHDQQPINISNGFVITGRRHHNCYQTIKDLGYDINKYMESLGLTDAEWREHQGFITSLDRYVNRREAYIIAKANQQIIYGLTASEQEGVLISENLY